MDDQSRVCSHPVLAAPGSALFLGGPVLTLRAILVPWAYVSPA